MSTPSDSPNLQIVDILRRDRRRRQVHAGRVDALVLAERPAFDDAVAISPPSSLRRAARSCRRPAAGDRLDGRSAPGHRTSWRRGPGRRGSRRWRSSARSPVAQLESAARPRAPGPDLRAAEILQNRHLPAGTLRRGADAPVRRACVSCVPCEKLSRMMSAPAAMSASSIASVSVAGPTVAMILVWRINRSSIGRLSNLVIDCGIEDNSRPDHQITQLPDYPIPMGQIVPDAIERYLAD